MVSAGTAVVRLGKAVTFVVIGVLAFLSDKVEAQAQEVGTTICGCQPAVYEITLNFTVTCEDTDVEGPGIDDVACLRSSEFDDAVTDLVPVLITDIQFLELNQELQPLQQEPRTGAFFNGDVVRYTSVLAVLPEFTEETLPRAFQMILRGVNALDQPIQTTWLITYSNDCGIFPILLEGQRIGWSVFVCNRTSLNLQSLSTLVSHPPVLFHRLISGTLLILCVLWYLHLRLPRYLHLHLFRYLHLHLPRFPRSPRPRRLHRLRLR